MQTPRYIKRHELWRLQYRNRRYLEHLTEDDLITRFNDVFTNSLLLSEELKISLHPVNDEGEYWMVMFTHVLEEFAIRGYKYPEPINNRWHEIQFPKYEVNGLSAAVVAFRNMRLAPSQYLLKFGKYKYLKDTLDKGLIRIMPASSYDDPSLNPAIRDAELQVHFSSLPSEVKLEVIDGKTGKPKGHITPIGNLNYTLQARTNYYVYCLSSSYSLRMYGDFDADCCMVIKQPESFLKKIIQGFRELPQRYEVATDNCNYYDPFNTTEADLDVYFSKHFKYAYQKEYRIIWLPNKTTKTLDPIFLELGDLREFCEIIRL